MSGWRPSSGRMGVWSSTMRTSAAATPGGGRPAAAEANEGGEEVRGPPGERACRARLHQPGPDAGHGEADRGGLGPEGPGADPARRRRPGTALQAEPPVPVHRHGAPDSIGVLVRCDGGGAAAVRLEGLEEGAEQLVGRGG